MDIRRGITEMVDRDSEKLAVDLYSVLRER